MRNTRDGERDNYIEHGELGESDVEVSNDMGRRGWEGLAFVMIPVGLEVNIVS